VYTAIGGKAYICRVNKASVAAFTLEQEFELPPVESQSAL
jgi:hypothetical protein